MSKTKLSIILASVLLVLSSAISSKAVVAISATSLPNTTVGVPFSHAYAATGGTSPYSWQASGLPPGLKMSTSGTLDGTPTTAGSYSITFVVTDAKGARASTILAMTVVAPNVQTTCQLCPAPAPMLAITSTSLQNGTVGIAYSQGLVATGGATPYTWSVSGGALPPGMVLGTGGMVKGTPTASGSYAFTAKVLDSSMPKSSAEYTYSLTIVTP